MKNLTRSIHNRLIAGVCGGIAEYLRIDAIVVRAIALLLLFSGIGIIPYCIMWILMPSDY